MLQPRNSTLDFAEFIPGASPTSAVSVASLTATAKELVEGGLAPLWVRGDVIDFKRHRNGHWYFNLRDSTSQIRCVVWSRDQRGIPAAPDDGMEVSAFGRLTVYPARGELHLTITRMEARGDGLWRKALEETRLRLERDGLLSLERKRPLPYAPKCVAVVTSPDGAAIRDIIAVIRRRSPHVEIVVSATKVQGEGAPLEICAAIERVHRWGLADVMIVGRGGGGREDLWAFNDEMVARAIASSPIPTVSAVGHEVDITIADLVADVRAATPSVAAETVVPVTKDIRATLKGYRDELVSVARSRVSDARYQLHQHARTMRSSATHIVERQNAAVSGLAGQLHALSPLATLARGYAVARDPRSGETLSSVSDFGSSRPFHLTLRDGTIAAESGTIVPPFAVSAPREDLLSAEHHSLDPRVRGDDNENHTRQGGTDQ